MVAILSVLCVVALSVLVTRIASTALQLTGLSRETARFQARSAFTGVGFTTGEAEAIMLHPDRRRIILMLMLLGSAGIVTAIASLLLSFVNTGGTEEALRRGVVLLAGLTLLAALSKSRRMQRALAALIERALRRWTALDVRDVSSLVELQDDFTVSRFRVEQGSWLAGSTLAELRLDEEGVLLLGIIRTDGSYVGAPRGRYTLRPDETLILYGSADRLAEIQRRLAGQAGRKAHDEATASHRRELEEQDARQQRYADARGAAS